ncbi:MAG TPA: archease, partial [Acidobacteriota bacterium]
MKKFEELEHTADLGLRVYGKTLANLLANAAEGMFGLIGRAQFNASEMRSLTVAIRLAGEPGEPSPARANEELLYQWLKRLLQEFNLHSFFPVKFDVEVTADGCQGRLWGGTF